MTVVNYLTLKDIRVEAGMQNTVHDQDVSGDVNGVNTDFYTNSTPIVDRNGDEVVTIADVTAFVDGSAVVISSIDTVTGLIKLAVAPTTGKVVTLDYVWSPCDDDLLTDLREEAIGWLNRRVGKYIDLTTITSGNFPPEWRAICRLWAGAMIIIRDYGSGSDTDGSSKDGYKKLAAAKSLLQEWIDDYAGTDGEVAAKATQSANVVSDGNIFRRHTDLDEHLESCSRDASFFNRDC